MLHGSVFGLTWAPGSATDYRDLILMLFYKNSECSIWKCWPTGLVILLLQKILCNSCVGNIRDMCDWCLNLLHFFSSDFDSKRNFCEGGTGLQAKNGFLEINQMVWLWKSAVHLPVHSKRREWELFFLCSKVYNVSSSLFSHWLDFFLYAVLLYLLASIKMTITNCIATVSEWI